MRASKSSKPIECPHCHALLDRSEIAANARCPQCGKRVEGVDNPPIHALPGLGESPIQTIAPMKRRPRPQK